MSTSFPYNETQRLLHLPEERLLRNIKIKAKLYAKNPIHEKEIYLRELSFLEEIKGHIPKKYLKMTQFVFGIPMFIDCIGKKIN